MKNIDFIKNICNECIQEGQSLLGHTFSDDDIMGVPVLGGRTFVDLEGFKKWKSNCNILINMLGDLSNPWMEIFQESKHNTLVNVKSMIGGLRSIKEALDKGYLISIEDLIFAEAFSDLIEQSEYLFKQNYFLAAGVIARAVLEEKMRNRCNTLGIKFPKSRPTLNDFNSELYKIKEYDKIEFKNRDYLISIGNNAAHNKPVTKDEIEKLIEGVKNILLKYK